MSIEPAEVHIASAAPGIMPAPARRRKITTIYKTVVLTADNPWGELVNQNENRHSYELSAGQSAATVLASDLVIGTNQGDIKQAAGAAEALNMAGQFLPANVIGQAPMTFRGTNPVWVAVLGADPTYPVYVGVADNIYTD